MAAVAGVHRRCTGGYAVVSMVLGLGLVAFRDPHGIRPLVLGKRETASGTEYAIASESVALDILGFVRVRDIAARRGRGGHRQRRAVRARSAPSRASTRRASSNTCTSRARTR